MSKRKQKAKKHRRWLRKQLAAERMETKKVVSKAAPTARRPLDGADQALARMGEDLIGHSYIQSNWPERADLETGKPERRDGLRYGKQRRRNGKVKQTTREWCGVFGPVELTVELKYQRKQTWLASDLWLKSPFTATAPFGKNPMVRVPIEFRAYIKARYVPQPDMAPHGGTLPAFERTDRKHVTTTYTARDRILDHVEDNGQTYTLI